MRVLRADAGGYTALSAKLKATDNLPGLISHNSAQSSFGWIRAWIIAHAHVMPRTPMLRLLALGLCTTAHALAVGAVGAIPLLRCTAPALHLSMSSDEALWASLKARIAVTEESAGAPPPLGIEDIGADCMGPADVVEYVMHSMKADADAGAASLLSFAVKYDGDKTEDHLGQLQPGCFGTPAALLAYYRTSPRYTILADMHEWKCMGPPDTSNYARSAVQKLLVRGERGNWEELFVNMQLADVAEGVGKRWLITTVYKQGSAM